jgi:hypothetical protein
LRRFAKPIVPLFQQAIELDLNLPRPMRGWQRFTHLGLGRAYMMTGDSAKARAVYQDFFALWKDADPDVPILKEARRI